MLSCPKSLVLLILDGFGCRLANSAVHISAMPALLPAGVLMLLTAGRGNIELSLAATYAQQYFAIVRPWLSWFYQVDKYVATIRVGGVFSHFTAIVTDILGLQSKVKNANPTLLTIL